jgi:NitT/TauT family transport system substrate-binding protein
MMARSQAIAGHGDGAGGQRRAVLVVGRALRALALLLTMACTGTAPERPAAAPAAGSASSPASSAQPAPVATRAPDPLRVAYVTLGQASSYIWVAQEAGYFGEEGLAVDAQYIPGTSTAVQALVAGELQYISGVGSAGISAALGGADTVILATMISAITVSVMGLPELAPTAESIRGRTMAVTRFGASSDFVGRSWLRRIGLEPVQDVPIVQVGGNPEMAAALMSGAAQLVPVADLFALELQRQGYRELAKGSELGIETVNDGVMSTRSYVAAHEDVTRRYLRALVRGQARFIADPALTTRLMREYSKLEDEDILTRTWERYATRYYRRIPYTTPTAVQTVLEELSAADERARAATPEQFYDNRFVKVLEDEGLFAQLYPR